MQLTPALCAHISFPNASAPWPFWCVFAAVDPSLPSNLIPGAACNECRRRHVSAFCSACGLMVPRARPVRLDVMHQAIGSLDMAKVSLENERSDLTLSWWGRSTSAIVPCQLSFLQQSAPLFFWARYCNGCTTTTLYKFVYAKLLGTSVLPCPRLFIHTQNARGILQS